MAKMIDCYGPLTTAEITQLKANGVVAVGRYLGRIAHQWPKAMTPEEVALIKAAGLKIGSVWEGNPTYAAYFTLQQGVLDGAQALQDARWLGQPENTTIYFSVDFDAQPHDLAAIQTYFQGVRRSLGNYYKMGVYGGFRVIETITADHYWQTAAWSYGDVSKRAHIYQKQMDTHLAGYSVDIDEVTGEAGEWPMAYDTMKATFNGHEYPAVVVNGEIYPVWTLAKDAGANITKADFDDVEIDGKKVRQVTQDGNTYVHYADIPWIHPGTLANGVREFVSDVPPAPAQPAPAPGKHPIEAAYDAAKAKYGTVSKLVTAVKLPTGATEIIINTEAIDTKVSYIASTYDDNLVMKANAAIKIVDYMFV